MGAFLPPCAWTPPFIALPQALMEERS
jgi:hypothetical protein